jgi:hypothetical protein
MPTTITVKDPKASSNAGIDLSDSVNYTTVVSGTGVDFAWEGTSCVLLKNSESSASRNFTFTVPVPSGSGLTAIGSTPTSKVYSVSAGKIQYVENADAFRDPTTGKVTLDVSGANCSVMAIAQ